MTNPSNPLTFRPTNEVRAYIAAEQAARPGVPLSFLINEALRFAFKTPAENRRPKLSKASAKVAAA